MMEFSLSLLLFGFSHVISTKCSLQKPSHFHISAEVKKMVGIVDHLLKEYGYIILTLVAYYFVNL
ncbi:hypothetical protein Hanom_Chr01g00018111 [Helianthus anomalus]